jgi:2-polyprenyl-3-methyl-5-hydroxy-6-metoxy-1,4-benzoquinol methylase
MPKDCDRALDIGCGDGVLLPKMATRSMHVTGIDVSPAMISLARQNIHSPNVELVMGDFLASSLPAQSFDFVTAVAVIHHMPFDSVLSHVAELLRPGGVMAVVGLARNHAPADYAISAVSVPVSRLVRLRRGWWDSPARKIDPVMTYAEIKAAAEAILPGVQVRRRLYFRYTMLWRRPPRFLESPS